MKNDPSIKNFDGTQAGLYPHLKITNETYPRVLATRKIEHDADEYFGAFLTKTATRILIDFINRVFRIRSCDIPIDGNSRSRAHSITITAVWPHALKACAQKTTIAAMVDLVHLFLANRRNELTESLSFASSSRPMRSISKPPRYWRDVLEAVENTGQPAMECLARNDVVDTFAVDDESPECGSIW